MNSPSSSGKSTPASFLQKEILPSRRESCKIESTDDFLTMTDQNGINQEDVKKISHDLTEAAVCRIVDHMVTSKHDLNN